MMQFTMRPFHPEQPERCKQTVSPSYCDPHPCPWPAKRDGYCDRHHPLKQLESVRKKIAKLMEQLEAANVREAELANNMTLVNQ